MPLRAGHVRTERPEMASPDEAIQPEGEVGRHETHSEESPLGAGTADTGL